MPPLYEQKFLNLSKHMNQINKKVIKSKPTCQGSAWELVSVQRALSPVCSSTLRDMRNRTTFHSPSHALFVKKTSKLFLNINVIATQEYFFSFDVFYCDYAHCLHISCFRFLAFKKYMALRCGKYLQSYIRLFNMLWGKTEKYNRTS